MRLFTVLLAVLLFLPFESRADVACQYDCLAKGGLPEICDSKCGISQQQRVGAAERIDASEGDEDMPAMLDNYRRTENPGQKKEASEGNGSSASGGGSPYFTCIKECRDAGNKLQDCRTLCSED